jgi:hypothetical protein
MEYRPSPKGRSTEDNVECPGLWLYGAEKTAHFLGGRRRQGCDCSYGSYFACAWAVYGCPVLRHRCMAELCRMGAITVASNRGMSVKLFIRVKRPIDSNPLQIPCVLRSPAALLCGTSKTSRSLLLALWSSAINEPSGYIF